MSQRNDIWQYVLDHPGQTSMEITAGMATMDYGAVGRALSWLHNEGFVIGAKTDKREITGRRPLRFTALLPGPAEAQAQARVDPKIRRGPYRRKKALTPNKIADGFAKIDPQRSKTGGKLQGERQSLDAIWDEVQAQRKEGLGWKAPIQQANFASIAHLATAEAPLCEKS